MSVYNYLILFSIWTSYICAVCTKLPVELIHMIWSIVHKSMRQSLNDGSVNAKLLIELPFDTLAVSLSIFQLNSAGVPVCQKQNWLATVANVSSSSGFQRTVAHIFISCIMPTSTPWWNWAKFTHTLTSQVPYTILGGEILTAVLHMCVSEAELCVVFLCTQAQQVSCITLCTQHTVQTKSWRRIV